ncbi:hypothetical protein GCM10023205_57790 [Yinghuangia aomiensis]|uniref:HTH merR-type domain-containing protein n=1 Tax=Yinghuangia aomiensis TaxID=676205 RepID=A0ABP9HXT7_9ACTN
MTSTPPRAGGGRALVGIGEVMALLRPEFPDVSVSKIRFLEAEGLVEPQRTPSGYRKFGPSDLDRLRYVLRAQRDQYLPLKVIKDHLDAIDRGLEPAEDGLGAALAAADASPPAPVYFTRAELLAAAGIDDAALTRLEEFGLIEARRVVEVAGPEAGGADSDAAAGVPAARGSSAGAAAAVRAFEPGRAADDGVKGGAGADVVTGDVGFAVPGVSADVRTVDAVDSAVTGPSGGVGAVRDAAADVVPGDGAAMAVDVLSAQVLDAQWNGSAGPPAARGAADAMDAADAAPDDAPGSGRTTDAGADAMSSDVPSARAAVAPEPTDTQAAVPGEPAPAADDAAATASAAPKTQPAAAATAETADEAAAVSGDSAAAAAPDSPTDAPSTAPAALTSSSGPEAARAAHRAPDADAADTEAKAAPGAAETRTDAPDGPVADTTGRNRPDDVLQGPLADVRDQARPGGSDTPLGPAADAGYQGQDGGGVGTLPGPAADSRVQEQPGADDALDTTAGEAASSSRAPDRERPGAGHAVGTAAGENTSSSSSPHAPERPMVGGPTAPPPIATQTGAASSAEAKPAARPASARATASGADPVPRTVLRYDGDALVVARLVTALGEYGLEPRHLRQVKAAADREAALAEQIVAPLLHRRGAGAKSGAEETVRDLLSLTSRLHTVLVSSALRPLLDR